MKFIYTFLIFWMFAPFAQAYSNDAADLEKKLLFICGQYRQKLDSKAYKLHAGNYPFHLLMPLSNKEKCSLGQLARLFDYSLSPKQAHSLLKTLESHHCISVLRDFSMRLEEQVENKTINDIDTYYQAHSVKRLPDNSTPEEKFAKLQKILAIPEGFKFPFLKGYFYSISKPLEMLPLPEPYRHSFNLNNKFKAKIPNLRGQHLTFVGAGFPLSGIILNLLTEAHINLIEIDAHALKQAKRFLAILDKAGVVDIKHFTLRLADGKDLFYSKSCLSKKHVKTDVLYLAASLPAEVKKEILQRIYQAKNKELIIIDRYVSGVNEVLYKTKVERSALAPFKILSRVYPRNLYFQKFQGLISSDTRIVQYDEKPINCSTRILKLR